MYLQRFCAR